MRNVNRLRSGRHPLRITFIAGLLVLPALAAAQVLGPPPAQAPNVLLPAEPSTANWRQAMVELKLTPHGEMERKKHHSEIEASTADGRRVTVSFDLQGRLWEIEAEEHIRPRPDDAGPMNPQAAIEAVHRAGYADATLQELRKHHAIVTAKTDKAERVNLHVDRNGTIYKQIWLRDLRSAR
jgi:hypothetical protein